MYWPSNPYINYAFQGLLQHRKHASRNSKMTGPNPCLAPSVMLPGMLPIAEGQRSGATLRIALKERVGKTGL
jgi:hypothetical protein